MSTKKQTAEPMEEVSVMDENLLKRDQQYIEDIDVPKEKEIKRSKYVTIRHNSSDNYKDPNKAAELGTDLYPGGFSREMELAAIERGRKNFYLTGLDEKTYKQEWEKDFLKESLPILEQNFGKEVLDPFAADFWKTRILSVKEEETLLDLDNPEDLLTYWCIKGGGYPYIAKSPDDLVITNSRFYLDEPHLTYETRDDGGKLRDRAIGALTDIDESGNSFSTMFHLHKNLITTEEGITYNTPKSIIYKALRKFIEGDYSSTRKKLAPKVFLEAVNIYRTNKKRSVVTAYVNDSINFGLLAPNKDGHFVNNVTSYSFKTSDKERVIEMLMSPSGQEEFLSLMPEVQNKWNKY